jgi:hypothetical protein
MAAVRAFERVNGRVAVGGVKIDHSESYCAAAFWAGVIDIEVQRHVSSLSLQANGGHSKGSAKIVMLRRRSDTLRWRLSRTANQNFARASLSRPFVKLSTDIHSPSTDISTAPRQHTRSPGPARGLYLGVLHPVLDRVPAWQGVPAGVF